MKRYNVRTPHITEKRTDRTRRVAIAHAQRTSTDQLYSKMWFEDDVGMVILS
jgi:hypothetical protein